MKNKRIYRKMAKSFAPMTENEWAHADNFICVSVRRADLRSKGTNIVLGAQLRAVEKMRRCIDEFRRHAIRLEEKIGGKAHDGNY